MFDDLKNYLLNARLILEGMKRDDIPLESLMEEVSQVATDNWVNREGSKPDLTTEQLMSATNRVMARLYNNN